MKPDTSYPIHRAKYTLAACLAALFAVATVPLQAQVVAADRTATSPDTEEGVQVLSAFEVSVDQDQGYLKTNAATATKIGMRIQDIPLNVSVISREFLDDTNAKSLTDLFRYSATASGDTRFAMRVPANSATPQGTFTMRGFVVNTIMRNGIFRYANYSVDQVERVEVIKGPASVFFGQGYPGGVINYVTKMPSFVRIPTTMSVQQNSNSGQKVILDHNAVLSQKAAFRIVGSWEDTQGERRFEFRQATMVNPSVTFLPLDSKKLKITLEAEYSKEQFNWNDYDWIWSDYAGWKAASTSGQYGVSTATLKNTIAANTGNGLAANVVQDTTTPTLAYATYINAIRTSTGNWSLPAYTSVMRGARVVDASGNLTTDEGFNYTSRGADTTNTVKNFSTTVDLAPFDWLDIRYNFLKESTRYYSVGQGGGIKTPYADLQHWLVRTGNLAGYYRFAKTHTIDAVAKFDILGVKTKILGGFQRINPYQQYMGGQSATDTQWAFLPGARNTTSNPDYAGTNKNLYNHGNVPVNQVILQRDGSIKPVRQIYSNWDAGFEIDPDVSVYHQENRNALDGYKSKSEAQYLNMQASLLDDRLNLIGGYRMEKDWERGQYQSNNYPWYVYFPDMHKDAVAYPQDVWGHSISYQRGIPNDRKGNSWMGGASFALTKEISIYASNSKTFKFNSSNVGGLFVGDEELWFASALAYGQGVTPGASFQYLGQTITGLTQFKSILASRGVYDDIKNETGMNWEIGAKIAKQDGSIVGTLSFFRGERENQRLDDGAKQSNLEEPLNYSTDLFPVGSPYRSTRLLRWRTTDLQNQVEGAEAEVIWSPLRNYQAVINGSWLWTAKTVYDKTRAAPGSAKYTASTPAAQVASDIYYNARLENVPEYRFNMFNRYTFTDGPVSGLSIGLGARYSSETVVSRSVDWNPLAGGYQAGNYLVFDVTLSYPWEISGYKINTRLGVYNAADEKYSEGSFAMSPARNWTLTNTLSF